MWRHRYDRYDRFPRKPTVGELQAKADQQRAKLAGKGETLHPVVVVAAGRKLTTTWWGQAWCTNLERYADYVNRIGRGRSYLRNGMVLDLQISLGTVAALVQGSRPKPYKVGVRISPLDAGRRHRVEAACRTRIESLGDLLAGAFPKELEALFTEEGQGLFPEHADIQFSCTCPDSASLCKHVAATLYGIGVRFDHDPGLFFALRGIAPADLVGTAVKRRTEELLAKGEGAPQGRAVVAADDVADVFGIELSAPTVAAKPTRKAAQPKPRVIPKTTRQTAPKTVPKAKAKPRAATQRATPQTVVAPQTTKKPARRSRNQTLD